MKKYEENEAKGIKNVKKIAIEKKEVKEEVKIPVNDESENKKIKRVLKH